MRGAAHSWQCAGEWVGRQEVWGGDWAGMCTYMCHQMIANTLHYIAMSFDTTSLDWVLSQEPHSSNQEYYLLDT
jgi:hypothetical protein